MRRNSLPEKMVKASCFLNRWKAKKRWPRPRSQPLRKRRASSTYKLEGIKAIEEKRIRECPLFLSEVPAKAARPDPLIYSFSGKNLAIKKEALSPNFLPSKNEKRDKLNIISIMPPNPPYTLFTQILLHQNILMKKDEGFSL